METTPLLSGLPGPPGVVSRVSRRLSALPQALKRTPRGQVLVPAMGSFGSFLFLSNLITGPGMLAFPAAYQEGGWLLGISFTLLFAGLSIFTSTLITKVVTHVKQTKQDRAQSLDGKGSEHSAQFVEYDTIVQATGNKALLVTFQIAFLLSMTLMSISCICIVARALDNLSITVLGNAWGLQILPDLRIRPSCRSGEDCRARQAFQDTSDVHGYVITQGYFLTLAVSGPFSLLDINDWFQGVTYFISLVCLLEMIAVFSYIAWAPSMAADRALYGGGGTVPAVSYNVGLLLEVNFWSWAIGFAIPMWRDEVADHVSVGHSLWAACSHRAVLDILLGLSGAAAFPGLSTLSVLDELRVRPDVGIITEMCGIGFAVSALLPNVVDYQMAVTRNLELHLGPARANVLGVGLPYSVAWLFYFGAAFNSLVNATSIALNGAIEFVVPCVLFLLFAGSFRLAQVRVCGLRMSVRRWKALVWAVLILVLLLIVLAYALNALVSLGVYGPNRKHAEEEQDYSHYAAYDDLGAPPAPPLAPAAAPAPAPAAALIQNVSAHMRRGPNE